MTPRPATAWGLMVARTSHAPARPSWDRRSARYASTTATQASSENAPCRNVMISGEAASETATRATRSWRVHSAATADQSRQTSHASRPIWIAPQTR